MCASQTAGAIASINMSFIWVPTIAMCVAVVSLIFFDLDKKYAKIAADLAAGKHKGEA